MRKEVIFAILIGLLLGFIILYGIRLANLSTQKAAAPTPTQTVSPSLTPTPTQTSKLTIKQPSNHAVVNTAILTITGTTIPDSQVALQNSEDDTLTTADTSGNFSAQLKLTGGENIIKVTALSPEKILEEVQLIIIYTTAKID